MQEEPDDFMLQAAAQVADEGRNDALKETFYNAMDKKPEEAARRDVIARGAGLAPVEVDGRESEVEKLNRFKATDIAKVGAKYPVIRDSMTNMRFAEKAHDDVEGLVGTLDMLEQTMKPDSNTLEGVAGNFDAVTRRGPALLGLVYGMGNPEELIPIIAESSKQNRILASRTPDYMVAAREAASSRGGFFGAMGEWIGRPRALVRSGVEQLPFALPSIGAGVAGARTGAMVGGAAGSAVPGVGNALGASVGAATGAIAGQFAGGVPTEIFDWLEQGIQDAGYDLSDPAQQRAFLASPDLARIRAEAERKGLTTAGVNAAFAPFAGKFLSRSGSGAGKIAAAASKDVASNVTVEAAGEAAGQYAAVGKVDWTQVAEEAVTSVPSSVVEAGAAAVEARTDGRATPAPSDKKSGLMDSLKQAASKIAGEKETQIKTAVEAVKASKLAKLDPVAYRDFVQKKTGNEEIHIDGPAAVTFFQSLPPKAQEELAGIIPTISKKIEESIASGVDVSISKADYLAFIAPHEEAAALVPHIRFSESEYTIDQLQNVDDLVALAEEDVLTSEDTNLEPDEVLARRLESELSNAGLTPEAARLDANLARNAFNAFGDYTNSEKGQKFIQDAFGKLTIRAPQSSPRIGNVDIGYVKGIRNHFKAEARNKKLRNAKGAVTDMFGRSSKKTREKATPKPVIAWLSERGVRRDGSFAKELRAIGVTPERYPNLFTTNESGYRGADEIAASEFNAQFADVGLVAEDDGNGWVTTDYLYNVLSDEDSGKGGMTEEARAKLQRAEQYNQIRDYLDQSKGIDVMTAPEEEIMAALRDFGDVTENTPERELFQSAPAVDSAAFKAWFGDSKVVDADGKPLVVYHGTRSVFEAFDLNKSGANGQAVGKGFYFTNSKGLAEGYGEVGEFYLRAVNPTLSITEKTITLPQVKKILGALEKYDEYLLSNYGDIQTEGRSAVLKRALADVFDASKDDADVISSFINIGGVDRDIVMETVTKITGKDGFVTSADIAAMGVESSDKIYVVLSPKQIKSVNNRGTFDAGDARVLYQTMAQPTFFSALGRAVDGAKQSKADAKQWLGIINNAAGVKAEEIEWTGVREWLAEQDGQITKDAIQQFLAAGGVQIQEVTKDDQSSDQYVVMDENGPIAEFNTRAEAAAFRDREEEVRGVDLELYDPEDLASMGEEPTGGATKFSKWQLPGGKNYRELLLTLPNENATFAQPEEITELPENYGVVFDRTQAEGFRYSVAPKEQASARPFAGRHASAENATMAALERLNLDAVEEANRKTQESKRANTYKSSHFDEANILAHIRMNERTDDNGNRVLFLEEVQSDWHQAGRKKGYTDTAASAQKQAEYEAASTAQTTRRRQMMQEAYAGLQDGTFEGGSIRTFETNGETYHQPILGDFEWTGTPYQSLEDAQRRLSEAWADRSKEARDLATRVMRTREALNESLGTVPDAPFKKTWHELAMKRVLRMAAEEGFDKVAWTTGEQQAERYDLSKQIESIMVQDAGDDKVNLIVTDNNGREIALPNSQVDRSELPDIIGKELAAKIDTEIGQGEGKQSRKTFSGLDLKVGGEGMKGFYDKILPSFMNKYAKKWGAKVEDVTMDVVDRKNDAGDRQLLNDLGVAPTGSSTMDVVHSVAITDAMRKSVMQGQPLFQTRASGEYGGSIAYLPDGRTVINLFEKANLSTALHEMGHFYWGMLDKMNGEGLLNERGLKDWSAVRTFVGAKDGEALTVEQEEKVARAFEAYLREGKAPSLELQGAFQRFKAWLTRIYKSARELDIEINDEIRGVFDRMLATDGAIEAMKDKRLFRPDSAVMEMLNAEQKAQYVRQAEKAIATSKERLLVKALRQAEKSTTGIYKEARAKVEAEVTERVNNAAVYKAMDAMQRGELADGTKFDVKPRLDRKMVRELMGQDTLNAMPRATVTSKGLDPNIAADMFGFTSGRAMIEAMVNAPTKKQRINDIVDNEMRERYGDMLNDGTLEREALESFHNVDRAAQLELEMKFAADKAGVRAATNEEFRIAAQQILGGKSVDSVMKSSRFYYAEVKASREFGRALAKKDYAKAADAKRRQLLNHHLLRESEAAQTQIERALKSFAKLNKPLGKKQAAKIDEDYHNKIRGLLAAYSFDARMSDKKRTQLEMATLAQWAAEENALDDAHLDIPAELLESDKAHYRDLTFDEFLALRDTVLNIEAQGRKKREYTINGEKRAFAAVVNDAATRMLETMPVLEVDPLARSGVDQFIGQAGSSLIKTRTWVRQLDGGNDYGIFNDALMRPVDEGMDRYITRKKEAGEKLSELIESNLGKEAYYSLARDKFEVDGIGAMTKENLLTLALNWGNDGNKEALLAGEPTWSEAIVRAAFEKHMTKADWDFVEGTWAWVNTYWPEVAALEKRRKGFTPKKVQAKPDTVMQNDNGTAVERKISGGYYPIMADFSRTARGQRMSADEIAREMGRTMGAAAQTRRNHTKERKGVGKDFGPLLLNLSGIQRHVDMVIRDIELGEATHAALRFVRNPVISKGLQERIGLEATQAIDLWVKDVAVGDLPTATWLSSVQDKLRSNASIAYMGFSISTFVQQFTGLTNSAVALGSGGKGWKWIGSGIKQVLRAYTGKGEMSMSEIHDMSEFMRNRADTQTREIAEVMASFSSYRNKSEAPSNKAVAVATAPFRAIGTLGRKASEIAGLPPGWQKIFLAHIQKAQSVIDSVVWLGALEKARVELSMNDADAVQYANGMVRTQASGLIQDLSGIERGSLSETQRFNRFIKTFTFMYSYYNAKLNLVYGKYSDAKAGRISVASATIDIITVIWVDALLSSIVLGKTYDDEEDDEKDLLTWLVKQPLSAVPLGREVASALDGFENNGNPYAAWANSMGNMATQVGQGELDAALTRSIVSFTGLTVGLPSTQINRLINVAERASEGKEVGYIDFVRSRTPEEK